MSNSNLINLINISAPSVTGLVAIVKGLIDVFSSVAVGIIIFTIILKLLTLPFDIISRVQMRKNSLKMEEMRPELERLQKQYANDKNLYSQKMMALYKKNGYSMMGSCLPIIVTTIIFFVAIGAFTSYSTYATVNNFYEMSLSYNQVIYDGFEEFGDYIKKSEDGIIFFNDKDIISYSDQAEFDIGNVIFVKKSDEGENHIAKVSTKNGYCEYKLTYSNIENNDEQRTREFFVLEDRLNDSTVLSNKIKELNIEISTFADYMGAGVEGRSAVSYIEEICGYSSAIKYESVKTDFLWVKNIWEPDSMCSHPISENPSVLSKNQQSCGGCNCSTGCSCLGSVTAELEKNQYDKLVVKLNTEKEEFNGYFILVALTAGLTFIMQFVSAKGQKAQMELQSVDGQGAQTQKMMMWMMPLMMTMFAFSMTAAFSIYMIVSSVISIVSTILINYFTEKKYGSSAKTKTVIRGRVYNSKQEVKEEPKKKTKYQQEIDEDGFLSGRADKKRKK